MSAISKTNTKTQTKTKTKMKTMTKKKTNQENSFHGPTLFLFYVPLVYVLVVAVLYVEGYFV